ncbi:hypothetical protein CDAR_312111 [Caerostris darwini]|uniref:Uncharacterized protein n=1 Tax=Caerostris darwini TaxID=1538125 RepID=A0AAV4S8J1_9ARAC|nr:hypothetical protein CDAR_312111 [Caerostris darwini]
MKPLVRLPSIVFRHFEQKVQPSCVTQVGILISIEIRQKTLEIQTLSMTKKLCPCGIGRELSRNIEQQRKRASFLFRNIGSYHGGGGF